ncbi:hypothetical protein ABZX56_01760 [Streptomyces parvulus]|uniref:hypothetical protein n=1 Tax=Streptomyces parvulus TaxID=146923 RepID=UPI0033BC1C6C
MAARKRRRPYAWTVKELGEDVLPDRRLLALALQEVCRRLIITTPDGAVSRDPTQAQAAEYLKVSETALTRYLRGQRIPPEGVAAFIFDTVRLSAGDGQDSGAPGITKRRLLELRARAEQERCANCSRHRDAVQTAAQKLRTLEQAHQELERSAAAGVQELGELRQRVTTLKREVRGIRASQPTPLTPLSGAGQQQAPGAAFAATPLPVPGQPGDRQRSETGTLAARNIARRTEELLHGGRPDSILALLRHTAEAYSPVEVALLVTQLRERGQDGLAANLVHIYARDHSDQDVVRTALILHEQHALTDAEALLRIAAAHPGPAPSPIGRSGSAR